MSQLSLLSVEVSQSTDIKKSNGDNLVGKPATKSAFSDVIEQHYQERKHQSSTKNSDKNGNHQPPTAMKTKEHKAVTEQSIDASDKTSLIVDGKPPTDEHTLPVIESPTTVAKTSDAEMAEAGLGKESKPLVNKASEASVNQSPLNAVTEAARSETKAYEPKTYENKAVENKPSGPGLAETATPESDETIDLLKMLHGAQKFLTKAQATSVNSAQANTGATVSNNTVVNDSEFVKQNIVTEQMLTQQQKAGSASGLDKTVPSANSADSLESAVIKTKAMSNFDQQTQDKHAVDKNLLNKQNSEPPKQGAEQVTEQVKITTEQVKQSTVATVPANGSALVEQIDIEAKTANNKSSLNQQVLAVSDNGAKAPSDDLVKVASKTKDDIAQQGQVASREGEPQPNSNVDEASLENEKQNFRNTPSTQNIVAKSEQVLDDNGTVKNTQQTLAQTARNDISQNAATNLNPTSAETKVNDSEVDRAAMQGRVVNQATANVVTSPIKEQLQSATLTQGSADNGEGADDNLDKNTEQVKEEGNLNKSGAEKVAQNAERVASIVNQTIETASRPTMTSAELAMQQEHSFESSINKLSTNAVQNQKSITALNTETIAIYRKDFANAVKEKVMVMVNQKIQQVEIQLDPPEMGNVHVRLNIQNEQAAVQFVVQNQQAKEALEQNMGKLREMLAENGVDVGDANIEQRQPGEQSESAMENRTRASGNGQHGEQELDENQNQVVNMVKASSTGVDYYA